MDLPCFRKWLCGVYTACLLILVAWFVVNTESFVAGLTEAALLKVGLMSGVLVIGAVAFLIERSAFLYEVVFHDCCICATKPV